MNVKVTVGKNMSALRQSRGWSRFQLAQTLGRSVSCITNIEAGIRCPSLEDLIGFSRILRVDVRIFFVTDPSEPFPARQNLRSDWPAVGQKLRQLREARQIPQYLLALQAHVTTSFLCNLEKGRVRSSLALLDRLADTLRVPLWALFTAEE